MKIVHVILAGILTDNWTYQDNLITKYHKCIGHNVSIITSSFIYNSNGLIKEDPRRFYRNENGIKVLRLKTDKQKGYSAKFKRFKMLYSAIEDEKPDVLFVHGCQFIDVLKVAKYAKKNPSTIVYVDNHADFSNSATGFISKYILHKIIWRYCAKKIEPYTRKFYGVLPARVDFLTEVYKIPKEKIELLVMGADDEMVSQVTSEQSKHHVRSGLGIKDTDFLIVTGGKIDNAKKQILFLMEAIRDLGVENVKLVVFGSVVDELKNKIKELVDGQKVQYIGWVDAEESYKYFAASNLVVFPGRHSVFWEQVVALGVPMVVKYWKGTTHIDLGGNVEFLETDSKKAISELITEIVTNKNKYSKMKNIALSSLRNQFLYSNIAEQSIRE